MHTGNYAHSAGFSADQIAAFPPTRLRAPTLVALGGLSRPKAQSVPDAALRNNGHALPKSVPPRRFSKPFMEVMALSLNGGHVSVRRMANLLEVTVEDLAKLFSYGPVSCPR